MNKNRFAKVLAVPVGFILLIAAQQPARTQSPQRDAVQPQQTIVQPQQTRVKPQSDPLANDFAGLNYTDEQKAQVEKIRQDAAARKDAVLKDGKLTADQKDAMLVGYNRLAYGSIYRVLTPDQKRQVRLKVRTRRLSETNGATKAFGHGQQIVERR